jgi:ribonuclease Y
MEYVITGLGSAAIGYLIYLIVFFILPKRLAASTAKLKTEIVADAKIQAEVRKKSEAERAEEERQMFLEQLEDDIKDRTEDLKIVEIDLEGTERTIQLEEQRVQKAEKEVEVFKQKAETAKAAYDEKLKELNDLETQLRQNLEQKAGVNAVDLKRSLQSQMTDSRLIECQKVNKFLEEELVSSSKKVSQRIMARALSRYAPEFYWPKMINSVEIADRQLADTVAEQGEMLINEMKEKAGIEIELLPGNDFQSPALKLAGGAGINREAVRNALNDILPKGPGAWGKAAAAYDRAREALEQQAIVLGRKAINEVRLHGIHPEIQKLVGYLNWRTSYRQNQWHHTVEVAKLAGIIAHEVGVDPDQAKRCGLLHDIGKALDYRIEGSHAVISGDYADRFGENKIICDTVMSHHNDLVMETPLSYVLKAADTLSGARPGARVNLEEGYQMRLSGIEAAVRSFPGIIDIAIMNGAREVHVEVNHKRVQETDLQELSTNIAKKIQDDVAFPGEIKILVSRRFEATAVA